MNGDRLAIEGGTPYRKNFLVFGAPHVGEEEIAEVAATLRSGWLSTGPRTKRFEEAFRNYVGCRHALALNSCTAGLHLALDVLNIGAGDEVITTPITFTATANVIVLRGATPVFADVDPSTMNVSPGEIEKSVTPRTKAIIPVHFAGRPCEMDPILEIAAKNNLFVVEDAAHAVEASYRGRKVGDIGHVTSFSFYATKNLVTGEGGMATTANEDWDAAMRVKSLHGLSRTAWKRYSSEGFQSYDTLCPGYKYNMADIQAAMGIHQLARIEENLNVRERHWRRYNDAFAGCGFLALPPEQPHVRHARHLYTPLLDVDALGVSRDRFVSALQAENIGVGIHFTALHLHSFYREKFGFARGRFPNAEYVSDRTFSIPLSPALTDGDVEDVIGAVMKVLNHFARKRKGAR
ncbi:MAG: DegT/DnrJ/EryC1/StrS aminotransferase family protein [bacterium]